MTDLPKRKNLRLKDYDYSSNGAYFITICTHNKAPLFGQIIKTTNTVVGADLVSARGSACPQLKQNNAGKMIENIYKTIINTFDSASSEKFIVMPNHFHGIIEITGTDSVPTVKINEIIQIFKSKSTVKYIEGVKSGIYPKFNKHIWQRNYYEHIIRNEVEYQKIWDYIDTNPAKWLQDKYFIQ